MLKQKVAIESYRLTGGSRRMKSYNGTALGYPRRLSVAHYDRDELKTRTRPIGRTENVEKGKSYAYNQMKWKKLERFRCGNQGSQI